jgi:hypothetical protein
MGLFWFLLDWCFSETGKEHKKAKVVVGFGFSFWEEKREREL